MRLAAGGLRGASSSYGNWGVGFVCRGGGSHTREIKWGGGATVPPRGHSFSVQKKRSSEAVQTVATLFFFLFFFFFFLFCCFLCYSQFVKESFLN